MTISIACAQIACANFDPDANLERADRRIRESVRLGAKLILLPELITTGYTFEKRVRRFAEPLDGATTRWMQQHSRRFGCWLGGGFVERWNEWIFDTFVLTGPSGELYSYRKRHPAFYELLNFSRGRQPGIFDTPIGRIGVMICWDMTHSYLADEMAGKIDLLLICSAWPDVRRGNIYLVGMQRWLSRQPSCRPKKLAEKLRVPVVYCNSTGKFATGIPGLGITYRSRLAGCSSITDESGRPRAVAGSGEEVLVAHVSSSAQFPRRWAA